jgi:hypothetical protein
MNKNARSSRLYGSDALLNLSPAARVRQGCSEPSVFRLTKMRVLAFFQEMTFPAFLSNGFRIQGVLYRCSGGKGLVDKTKKEPNWDGTVGL